MIDVRVQSGDFDPGRHVERLRDLHRAFVASIVAVAEPEDVVEQILIEHYAAMAKAELGRIAEEANGRWPLGGIILIHRHGELRSGDRIFFAGVAAADLEIAHEACGFLGAALRTRAPFWRKDISADGTGQWRQA